MPLSNSLTPELLDSANLDIAAPINPRTRKILLIVMLHRKRVHLRVEELSETGEVIEDKHSRMGLVLWRTLALPSFTMYARSLGIDCEIKEVCPATNDSKCR